MWVRGNWKCQTSDLMLLLKYKKNLKLEIKLLSPRKLRGCIISCRQHPSLQVDSLALELDSSTPGLDRWCMSSGIKFKFLSHLNTPRTKLVAETELCWSKEIRWPLLKSRKTSVSVHAKEGSLGVKKGRVPHYKKFGHILTGFCSGIHLSRKLHMRLGKSPRTGQVWKRNPT